jgi:uncharacterized protein (DUF433 family)
MPTSMGTMKRIGSTAIELGVYLPLGATLKAKEVLTNRERLFGQYQGLVDRGRETLTPILGRQQQRLERVSVDVRERSREARESARGEVRDLRSRAQRAKQDAKGTARTATTRVAPSVEDLPIEGYDELTAQEVIDQLRSLTQEDLTLVKAYERRHQNRSTVIQAIDPRLVKLPISNYDEMTADEVVKSLSDLSPEELRTIRDYERKTKARQTVLERIESLLSA